MHMSQIHPSQRRTTARRLVLVALSAAALTLTACGDDAEDADTGDAAAAPGDATTEPAGSDPDDTDGSGSDPKTDGAAPAGSGSGEPGGTFTIEGTTWELSPGDQPTAMCSVTEDAGGRATITFMQADDGSRIDLTHSASPELTTVAFYDPDGNRTWVTGNVEEAEGLDPSVEISGSTITVEGSWSSVDDPSVTEEGRAQITC
jgi:hypothetical protein